MQVLHTPAACRGYLAAVRERSHHDLDRFGQLLQIHIIVLGVAPEIHQLRCGGGDRKCGPMPRPTIDDESHDSLHFESDYFRTIWLFVWIIWVIELGETSDTPSIDRYEPLFCLGVAFHPPQHHLAPFFG